MMTLRRVNLLPRELEEQRRSRQRRTGLILAGVGMLALLAGAYLTQTVRLAGERGRLEDQRERNVALEGRIAELADFARLDRELKSKTALVTQLTKDEVRWSVVLADISLVIPPEAWLTNFTATVNGAPGDGIPVLGSIQMNGNTFAHLDVAKWLTRLGEVDAFSFPYLTLSSKSTEGGEGEVSFNSSVELSDKAFRSNQPGAARKI